MSRSTALDEIHRLIKQGRVQDASSAFSSLHLAYPEDALILREWGLFALSINRRDEALTQLQRSATLNPHDARTHNALGQAWQRFYRYRDAEVAFRNAVNADEGYAAAHSNLIACLERQNKIDDAFQHLKTARALCPDSNLFDVREAIILRRQKKYREAVAILDKNDYPQDNMTRLLALNERANLLDCLGDYGEAFSAYDEFADLARNTWSITNHSKSVYLERITHYRSAFTADLIDSWPSSKGASLTPQPGLLIGFPRSGTTLIQHILQTHPAIHSTEEVPAIPRIAEQLERNGNYPECLRNMTDTEVQRFHDIYFKIHKGEPDWKDKSVLIDKYPLLSIHAGLFYRIFPGCPIIFALRHPCAAIWSAYTQMFIPNEALIHTYSLEDTVTLYCKTMELWLHYKSIIPFKAMYVRYEDLIDNMPSVTAAILEFLGLPWDDDVLRFHHHALKRGDIRTPSYSQITQPIYSDSKEKWLHYRTHFEPYFKQLKPYADKWGYEL